MRKNLVRNFLALFAIATMLVVSQSFTTAPVQEIIPADGCKFTNDPETYCIWGSYGVTNCANTLGATTCGVDDEQLWP